MDKVGRNDPCPCGSGKKYKKCCMKKDEEQAAASHAEIDTSQEPSDEHAERRYPPARAAEIENAFQRAINHLDRSDLDQAARAFRSVLRLDPEHYKALTGLGRCLVELGMLEEARKCFEKALEINPDYAQARINLELRS
ncbi:tetratricopeptide repeat protein [Candidatus Poribacteria bacterium]